MCPAFARKVPERNQEVNRLRLGVYIEERTQYRKEMNYEGTSFGQEDVRQVQDHSSPWQGLRYLRKPAP
jgi:hypothetical protein